MKIKSYKQFINSESVNEEFIGALVKGALGKLGSLFAAPFKDMAKDFKDMFKEDDPNSIKSVIMNNLNQAIDAAQKEIPNLKDDASILGVMDNFVTSLVQLANGIGKDIETALGKGKSKSVVEISKAILLGNKGMDFVGIVGLLDPDKGSLKRDDKFKYSKANYVTEVNKGKDIKSKQQIASKFLDNFQKEIQRSIDQDLTKEEIDNLYKKIGEGEGNQDTMTYDKLKVFYDKKTPVLYLLKGKTKEEFEKLTDDQKNKPTEAPANVVVGVKVMSALNDQDREDSVSFNDKNGQSTIKKSYSQILGPSEDAEQRSEEAKQAAEALGKIKQDPDKMKKVANFANFIQNDANKDKIAEIEKIVGVNQPTGETK